MSVKTLFEQAVALFPEFAEMSRVYQRKFFIAGKSSSCIHNYLRQISKLIIYYRGVNPLLLTIEQLEEYMYWLLKNETASQSSFKHLVCGLRQFYAIFGNQPLLLSLPTIATRHQLPVVFSGAEIQRLLMAPGSLKHRLILGVIYDCGLRISELIRLEIRDVDMERHMVHVRQAKGRKDRYVPISDMAVRGLRHYLDVNKPIEYLFNGSEPGKMISRESIRLIMRNALRKSAITKKACVHTLRHSYATHLLESGLNITTVRDQLGHSSLITTMMYLHIAQVSPHAGYSPLSVLYDIPRVGAINQTSYCVSWKGGD